MARQGAACEGCAPDSRKAYLDAFALLRKQRFTDAAEHFAALADGARHNDAQPARLARAAAWLATPQGAARLGR